MRSLAEFNRVELADRDVVVLAVGIDGFGAPDPNDGVVVLEPTGEQQIRMELLPAPAALDQTLQSLFAKADEEVLLIGKDGGLKEAWPTLPSTQELATIIDSMPMRQQEMQRQPKP